jgi:hypothetical protein
MGYFFESTPIVNVIKVTIRVNKKTLQLLEEFQWGEQVSNRLAKPLIYNVLCYFEKQGLDFASELQKTSNLMM